MFEVTIHKDTGIVDLVDESVPFAEEFKSYVIPEIEKSLKYANAACKAIMRPACNRFGVGYLSEIMSSQYEGGTEVFGCRGIKSADKNEIVLVFDTLSEEEYKQEWSYAEIGQLIIAFIAGIALGAFIHFGDKLF